MSRTHNSHRRRVTPDTIAAVTESENDAVETGPLRRCAATRERLPKQRMIRFVIGPDRTAVPDLAERLPGRGIWLSASPDVVQPGRARAALARAARGPVSLPPDLPEMLSAALIRRIGELLGLARRAGQAVAGFEKTRAWLQEGRASLILQAADGSTEERKRCLSGARGAVAVYAPLPADVLGAVFGRDRAVHVAVAPGQLAERIGNECLRLAGLAPAPSEDDNTGDNEICAAARPHGVWDE